MVLIKDETFHGFGYLQYKIVKNLCQVILINSKYILLFAQNFIFPFEYFNQQLSPEENERARETFHEHVQKNGPYSVKRQILPHKWAWQESRRAGRW